MVHKKYYSVIFHFEMTQKNVKTGEIGGYYYQLLAKYLLGNISVLHDETMKLDAI